VGIVGIGEINAAMGGFFMGQLFAGQTQTKPALLHFVCVRVEKDKDMLNALKDVFKDAFLNIPPKTELELEFTKKGELKVLRKNRGAMEKPLFVVGLCTASWTKKDYILTLGLRNEVGSPFPLNMAILRHLLINFKANKIEYEIW
jgi:hypothetical protein